MQINADKPSLWKADTCESIDFYNDWFLRFAPSAFRQQRALQAESVRNAFELTQGLRSLSVDLLKNNPEILPMLRMTAAPPLARDRLIGLAYTTKNLVDSMEGAQGKHARIPLRMKPDLIDEHLNRIVDVLREVADRDLFPWLDDPLTAPTEQDMLRSASVVADRLCGAAADPIIRNAQEKRQLAALSSFLVSMGYVEIAPPSFGDLLSMPTGTFTFRHNVSVGAGNDSINIPIDCIISKKSRSPDEVPILIEAKSAGDYTNTNKRRKEEAQKSSQLRKQYGDNVVLILFLCGYFDSGYLGYEAAEGIDWVWEHRIKDLLVALGEAPTDLSAPASIREKATPYQESFLVVEAERLRRQKAIDNARSSLERNQKGQFSTPFSLARDIVKYTVPLHQENAEKKTVLEPACGSGVFFSAFLGLGLTNFSFKGIEIDAAYASIGESLFSDHDLTVFTEDVFSFAESGRLRGQCQILITNPPYVRHHHLPPALKEVLRARVLRELGIQVSGLSGLYVYFMLLCDSFLTKDGIASWLIPCEFLYTNYGKALRDYLRTQVTLLRIHKFKSEDVQFDDALVSSCVVTYQKHVPDGDKLVKFTTGTFDSPTSSRDIPLASIFPEEKWTFLDESEKSAPDRLRLENLFQVTRGLATGNNEFFILSREKAEAKGINPQFIVPILPGPRYLKSPLIESLPDGTPLVDRLRYLLSIDIPEDILKDEYPSVANYLREGVASGVAEGYLCQSRKYWYLQEKRKAPRFVVSYMGRGDGEGSPPIRFFLNRSSALATNAFICLYPKPELQALLEEHPEREEALLSLLNAIPRTVLENAGRSYGGGLRKIEPKELRSVPLENPPAWLTIKRTEQIDLFAGHSLFGETRGKLKAV